MRCSTHHSAAPPTVKLRHTPIAISADTVWLEGLLSHAPDVRGLAVVLEPGGAEAQRRQDEAVAHSLQESGFATLTLKLLSPYEQVRDPDVRYNTALLGQRLLAASEWIGHQPPLAALPVGLVANDTACAAAIRAAVKSPERFAAIVCLGGRADLAGAGQLRALRVPTRFIVGRSDPHHAMLQQAYELLGSSRDWQRVEGDELHHAGEAVVASAARLTAEWLAQKLPAAAHPSAADNAPLVPPLADGVA
ncbi:putative phosphoribosyltransferase [Azoarcus olearius]|uniref:Phosphoribosyltransferase n=1 Tax=Azoarcus sp. (strain BH72) TaxID=418699 RepID=A1K637_AZOSB|nr:putative phosphoribosyltransferase [Azoarcus olearius]CAL94292.1 putative phosphoribosyltransferase [Azoarcus olearius]